GSSREHRCPTGTAWKSSGSSAAGRTHVMNDDRLTIAGIEFRSRLWVGTGKYKDFIETQKAIEASGADVVTVAVRRVNITDRKSENLLDYISPKKYKILPNTAGCSDRLGSGDPQPVQPENPHGVGERTGHRRRGRRHGLGCRPGDGVRS